jgi:hypothetical protein
MKYGRRVPGTLDLNTIWIIQCQHLTMVATALNKEPLAPVPLNAILCPGILPQLSSHYVAHHAYCTV